MNIPRRIKIIAFFVLLLIVDWFLYFRHAGHFFQGDTVFLLNHRGTSVASYLKEFVELNPSGWYRPLANELLESIMFPFAGLHPIPYRIPVYMVFLGITTAVYVLTLMLTRRHLAAALAAFFFTVHTANAYTTYDLGFMPELLFAFFYVCAALAYIRYLNSGSKRAYWLSLACFLGSLLSKEAAVTLPGTLFVAGVFLGTASQSLRERFMRAVRSIVPHTLILVLYLSFVVGHLNVMGITAGNLFHRTEIPQPGDYIPVFNSGVLRNADIAMTWAFNIPRGAGNQIARLRPGMLGYLKLFRAFVFALIAVGLIGSARREILFGSAWFWITLLPALPLVTHFLPYYVFLPVVGLSLVVGVVFVWLYDLICRYQPAVAVVVIVVIFGGVLVVTSPSIRANIRDNDLLGNSSTIASNTLNEVKALYSTLPAETTLYFLDAKEPLTWHHDFGGLFRMAYGMDNISAQYESQGDSLSPDLQNIVVFAVHNGHLVDETAAYSAKPDRFMKFVASDLTLDLSAREVTAGRDKYTISINKLKNTAVRIVYTVNDGPFESFTASLDAESRVTLDVSGNTRTGTYKFLAFTVPGSNEWIRTQQTLVVR